MTPRAAPRGAGILDADSTLHPQRAALAEYPAGAVLPPRIITDWELVWMLRGHARFLSDRGSVGLERHDLLLIPPNVAHSFVWDTRGPSRHGYLHFHALDRAGNTVPAASAVIRRNTGGMHPFAELCRFLLWLSDCQLPGRDARTAEVLRLMVGLLVQGPMPEPAPATAPAVAGALRHLALCWAQMPLRRVTVAELAAAGHVSVGHLHRLFGQSFAVSPASALELLRLSRAAALLDHTSLTIETIADLCGFADAAHLSHRCKAITGVAPSGHRQGAGSMPLPAGVQRIAQILWD